MTPTIPPAVAKSGPTSSAADSADPAYVLWKDFKPRDGGVLDLIDDMFAHLVQKRLRIVWTPGIVTEHPLDGGEPRSFEFAYRNWVLRTVMARMAVLCGEKAREDP